MQQRNPLEPRVMQLVTEVRTIALLHSNYLVLVSFYETINMPNGSATGPTYV